jgi:hypothetical protein
MLSASSHSHSTDSVGDSEVRHRSRSVSIYGSPGLRRLREAPPRQVRVSRNSGGPSPAATPGGLNSRCRQNWRKREEEYWSSCGDSDPKVSVNRGRHARMLADAELRQPVIVGPRRSAIECRVPSDL